MFESQEAPLAAAAVGFAEVSVTAGFGIGLDCGAGIGAGAGRAAGLVTAAGIGVGLKTGGAEAGVVEIGVVAEAFGVSAGGGVSTCGAGRGVIVGPVRGGTLIVGNGPFAAGFDSPVPPFGGPELESVSLILMEGIGGFGGRLERRAAI